MLVSGQSQSEDTQWVRFSACQEELISCPWGKCPGCSPDPLVCQLRDSFVARTSGLQAQHLQSRLHNRPSMTLVLGSSPADLGHEGPRKQIQCAGQTIMGYVYCMDPWAPQTKLGPGP
eukprot:1156271-Pelagomonas_calceolata.AAC.11